MAGATTCRWRLHTPPFTREANAGDHRTWHPACSDRPIDGCMRRESSEQRRLLRRSSLYRGERPELPCGVRDRRCSGLHRVNRDRDHPPPPDLETASRLRTAQALVGAGRKPHLACSNEWVRSSRNGFPRFRNASRGENRMRSATRSTAWHHSRLSHSCCQFPGDELSKTHHRDHHPTLADPEHFRGEPRPRLTAIINVCVHSSHNANVAIGQGRRQGQG